MPILYRHVEKELQTLKGKI